MTRIALAAVALLSSAVFATEVAAQSGQVTNPVPLTPPTLNLTTTTCQTTSDTPAMLCLNTSVSTAVGPTSRPTGAESTGGACNLSCTSQQLVCKQRC